MKLSFRITIELFKRMQSYCSKTQTSMSELIRVAITNYLDLAAKKGTKNNG